MASPFPGMDPYLEREMWTEFHASLTNAISGQLMPHLKPEYVALLSRRYVTTRFGTELFSFPQREVSAPDEGTGVAAPAVALPSPITEEVPLLSLEIRDVAERRLVTIVEILSPVNKRGEGARDYAARRADLLQTRTHLLEIDLLRGGHRVQLEGELPPAPYYVFLSRTERRPYTEVWPIQMREPLPTVPVPLLRPDPDVALDLQAALDACFELVGYEQLLDYAGPPPPPELSEADETWVAETLQAAGMRS